VVSWAEQNTIVALIWAVAPQGLEENNLPMKKPVQKPLKEYIKSIEGLVEFCLQEYPETRESDKELFLKVWELQGFRLTPEKQRFFVHHTASPISIRRVRQRLQEQGLYPADSLTVAKRTLKAMETRQLFRED